MNRITTFQTWDIFQNILDSYFRNVQSARCTHILLEVGDHTSLLKGKMGTILRKEFVKQFADVFIWISTLNEEDCGNVCRWDGEEEQEKSMKSPLYSRWGGLSRLFSVQEVDDCWDEGKQHQLASSPTALVVFWYYIYWLNRCSLGKNIRSSSTAFSHSLIDKCQ